MPPPVRKCPLCAASGPFAAGVDIRRRRHDVCPRCRLIFVAPAHRISPAAERARYLQHRNEPGDAGYVAFLRQAVDPVLPLLRPGQRGVDYGCGPTPVLAQLVAAAGWPCVPYDPHFFPDTPAGPYDFLFATEVVEHFANPAQDWAHMLTWLRPGGLLAVMTACWEDQTDFATWSYANDETHIAFYHRQTLDWIAKQAALTPIPLPSPHPRVHLWRAARA